MPAADRAAAEAGLDRLRATHPDATHHCYAWRIGWPPVERAADDGEPAGTAGQPILRVLRGAGLSDVLAVVVRWFGGTKLGKGGLARAYAGATLAAVADLPTRVERVTRELAIELPHERLGAVKRLIHPPEVTLLEERYAERGTLRLRVDEEAWSRLLEQLAAIGVVPRAADD